MNANTQSCIEGDRRVGQWRPMAGNGSRETAKAFVVALALMAPMLSTGTWMIQSERSARAAERLAAAEAALAYERLVSAPPGEVLTIADAVHGREIFSGVCAACHGADAKGMPGLGRNLVESDFVARLGDEALKDFIVAGRPEAKPIAMPPRAGRDDLTDDDLRKVVVYVRGMQDPRRMPELPAFVMNKEPSEAQKTSALAAAGGDAELAGYIASGNKLFHSLCVACHGQGGVGITGNGKALVQNEFIQSLDDDKLLAFIQQGRGPTDAKNTTGIQMPPKGGNPALSEDDILDVISYLRTLQGVKGAVPEAVSTK
jgi:mono/diheme cytochrome c family protein